MRIDLPVDEATTTATTVAAPTLAAVAATSGVLVTDDDPSFYVYRMGYNDEPGGPRTPPA